MRDDFHEESPTSAEKHHTESSGMAYSSIHERTDIMPRIILHSLHVCAEHSIT